ncbi:hypothetical protein IMG5_159090, partial [Ichthyophthirius multifiliis]
YYNNKLKMNQIQQVNKQGRKLFKYHIDQNIQRYKNQQMFTYRVNRWRWNTKDHSTPLKFFRLKYPLMWSFTAILVYDWTYGWTQLSSH